MNNDRFKLDIKELPDNSDQYTTDRLLINGTLEMIKYRVMYGYRLRIGEYDPVLGYAICYPVDICTGPHFHAYDIVKFKALKIIEANVLDGKPMLENIPPVSDPKPYFNDHDFITKINDAFSNAIMSILEKESNE